MSPIEGVTNYQAKDNWNDATGFKKNVDKTGIRTREGFPRRFAHCWCSEKTLESPALDHSAILPLREIPEIL